MMNSIRIQEFDPVIYPYKLWIVIDKTPEKIPDFFLQYDGKKIENINNDTSNLEAFTMPVMDKKKNRYGVVIYFISKKVMTCGTIAHESVHAAKFLFEHIGADIREHEPFEYVVGWIVGCCDNVKKSK